MAATCFVQPLDLVKNRMQLSGTTGKKEYTSSFHAVRSIWKNEGIVAMYNGLSAGLARQATYTTARLCHPGEKQNYF
jgi:solute carrier family 25 oxoglutarate transporter 11